MKNLKLLLITLLFTVCFTVYAADAPIGGSYSAYLVGVYDLRQVNTNTFFEIVNPTPDLLNLVICFFTQDGVKIKTIRKEIKANSLIEINTLKEDLKSKFGVIKIISMLKDTPKAGIVGFQKNTITNLTNKITQIVSESNLASITDWKIIYQEFKILISN